MMKKGKWSKEEDYLIRNHIEKHGIGRSWQAFEESSTAGSSCAKPVLASSPTSVKTPLVTFAAGHEPIEAVPVTVSAPARSGQKPAVGSLPLMPPKAATPAPPPAGRDQTGEMAMDIICRPMSPLPLGFMDPELACICGFDDIHSFLPCLPHGIDVSQISETKHLPS
ncbi:hypothetical protein EJB05_23864, partial [Eragrostis curvula]